MTITFENYNDVIVNALEKIISHARWTQQIFVAQGVWWLASILGLQQGLISYIDTPHVRKDILSQSRSSKDRQEGPERDQLPQQVHPDRVPQIVCERSVATVPRDLTEDQRLDLIPNSAEQVIQDSFRDRGSVQRNRVNPLPTTKTQLKQSRKAKCLQEARDKQEADRQARLKEIPVQVINRLTRDD